MTRRILLVEDNPQNRRDYEDLVIKTFFLSNADVKEIDKLLRSLIEARRLSTNEQLNAITLRDTADKVAIAEKLINTNDKAKAEGNQTRVAELEAWGKALQIRLHKQGFSTAPVDDILKHIKDKMPEIAKSAGVGPIVSKWDKETLAKYKSAEQVDITMALVDAFHPTEGQLKAAIDIQKKTPISLKEAENIND